MFILSDDWILECFNSEVLMVGEFKVIILLSVLSWGVIHKLRHTLDFVIV